MDVSDARRLEDLEDEHGKLKRLLADAMLGTTAFKDLPQKNGEVSRLAEAVAYLRGHSEMSELRACSVLAADQKMVRYTSAEGLAAEGWSTCCGGRTRHRASTASTGSNGTRVWGCASARAASDLLASGLPF